MYYHRLPRCVTMIPVMHALQCIAPTMLLVSPSFIVFPLPSLPLLLPPSPPNTVPHLHSSNTDSSGVLGCSAECTHTLPLPHRVPPPPTGEGLPRSSVSAEGVCEGRGRRVGGRGGEEGMEKGEKWGEIKALGRKEVDRGTTYQRRHSESTLR